MSNNRQRLIKALDRAGALCFDSRHEFLLPFCIFFRVFLVRLLFYAVCPGKGVRGLGAKNRLHNQKPGQTEESPRLFSFDVAKRSMAGGFLPAFCFWEKGARDDHRHEGRRRQKDRDEVVKRIKELGYKPHIIHAPPET